MKKRILIVDDEVEIVDLLKSSLLENNFDVLEASNGLEGLEKARREKPDLMVLDLMLPKIDGYKVCGLLKRDPRFSRTPIILFSARAQEEDQKLGEEVGADAYITKPFQSEVLLNKIRELLSLEENLF